MKTEKRLAGIFSGDSHHNTVIDLGERYGNKKQAQTGHFSYYGTDPDVTALSKNFWGFRELVITPNSAYGNHIRIDTGNTKPYYYGHLIDLERRISQSVTYTLPNSDATANWGASPDGIYYIATPNDMLAFSQAAQTDTFTGKTVKLVRDIDIFI